MHSHYEITQSGNTILVEINDGKKEIDWGAFDMPEEREELLIFLDIYDVPFEL